MIDKQLIESAINIRRDYLNISKNILVYENDIRELSQFLLEKAEQLRAYKNKDTRNIKTNDDLNSFVGDITKELREIELEEEKIKNKMSDINKRLEQLRKDEEMLYKTIKERYPQMDEKEIIKEIHSHLKE